MLSNRRLIAVSTIVLCCNTAILILFVHFNTKEPCQLTIDKHQKNINYMPDDFLSFGIDANIIYENNMDFKNTRLQKLAAELAPAQMRLGGTMSDRLIFSKDDIALDTLSNDQQKFKSDSIVKMLTQSYEKNLPFFIMTGKKWSEINDFCNTTNIKLLFSFNVLLRIGDEWIDENAIDIINFSRERGYSIDWQLGNEPNSFKHVFNVSVSPRLLSTDFQHLRELLNENGYKRSLLVGPDTTRPQPKRPECLNYMVQFLGNVSENINVISWHQYYLNSRTATLQDFWNPSTFDLLKQQINTMRQHTTKYKFMPMWLSETSTAYGGGAPGLSNSFAGSPLWLDKLGLASKHNITKVIRQSFYGGNYSLLDESNLQPLPDWWVSILYKKLVGNKVLHLHCNCTHFQRLYVHCTKRNYTSDNTAVTIYGVNLEFKTIRFNLNGSAFQGHNLSIDEYILRAPSNNRKSKVVLLNGWQLNYKSELPPIKPVYIRYGKTISMPPFSIGFWVVHNTAIKGCK